MIKWALPTDLDRAATQRMSTAWVAEQWGAAEAQLLVIDSTGRFATNDEGNALRMITPEDTFDAQRHLLLGQLKDVPIFATESDIEGPAFSLRDVGYRLTETESEIAAVGVALTHWHRGEGFCPRCGNASTIINGGMARSCAPCELQLFPRTDPAVIVAIIDPDDRILLGGQAVWATGRVSVLAGFVEAGESLEQAVHREIAEESDIKISEVRYFGSQPWPMPRSLMLGFAARAATTEISVDGEEIVYADWFTRERLRADVAAGKITLPNQSSIAWRLINSWLEGTLPL